MNKNTQTVMDTCLDKKPERVGPIVVEDLRKDLFADFSAIASALPQDCVLFEKEHLRVYLRIRPFTTVENESGESQECVSMEPPDTVLLRAPRSSLSTRRQTSHSDGDKPVTQTTQRFQFSQVYGPDTTQRQMFDGTVKRLVRDVLEGGNSIVFTYGVTNAGKTFTFLGPESDGGILPRSLNVIFNSIDGRVYAQNNIKPHRCRDFTRLTKDQQDEESTNKRNLMRLSKESDFLKSTMSSTCRSTILEGSSLSDISDQGEGDSFCLDVDSHTKYSVWVSFCEIYNENIYDLLEPVPNGSHRRTVLRLSQDIKGNTFVKDLKWVQVNNSEEAYKVLKIGKKNQSFSCTKLNNVSSRSHSIFSIRILRIEDVGIPRVHTISELSLCDLAGSERCAKTQNKGVQLKEAGNINTSLLILGKCINALRLNQQAKFQQHVPFRESKLTHYLQGFFCGRGKACMIVNINQCASMYDETLNVLKFSAIAQKVVVLNIKPVPAIAPKRSARDVSLIINNAGRKNLWSRRESSMVAWETTLEDVQEDGDEEEDDNEEEESCDESMAEETILEAGEEDKTVLEDFNGQFALVEELREKLLKEEAEKLALESHIREEVTTEFMELFSKMESDYNERLAKEREIIEDRADKRLAILKNLVSKSVSKCASVTGDEEMTKEDKVELLEGIIDTMRDDLARIRRDAEAAQTCLVDLPESPGTVANLRKQMDDLSEELLKTQQQLNLKTNEIDQISMELKQLCGQLEDAKENLESQTRTFEALMEICHEKDDVITKLQEAIDQNSEGATRDTALVDSIKEEILSLKQNCKCMSRDGPSAEDGRNRHADVLENLDDQPALKKGSLEDERVILSGELEKLQAECRQKDMTISQLKKEHEVMVQKLDTVQGEIKRKNEDSDELKREKVSFEQTLQKLTDDLEEQTDDCEAVMASLEKERKETARLSKDNKALVNGIFQLQQTSQKAESSVKTLQTELIEQTERSANLLEELEAARALLKELEDKSNKKSKTIESSTLETERLQKEAEELKVSSVQRNNSKFHDTIDAMKRECESVVEQLLQKSQWIADLEQELNQVREQLSGQEELCTQLRHELETQRSEAQLNLQDYELEKGAYNEIMKSYSDLEKMAGHLKERIVDLEVQVQASGDSSERVVVLEKQLAEREAQCGALQARLEEAQRKLAQVEESPINKSKEKVIEDMRLALTEQERTQTEQEQILEAKVKEIEALSQELMSLKDSCLPKNVNSAKFSHVINCPGENVKQEHQRTEERLKLVNEQNEVEKQKRLEERAILMEGAEGPEQEESQCPAPELMRECQKELCRSTLQTEEVKLSKHPSEKEEESGSVVEALKLEMQTLQERNAEKERKLRDLQDHSNFQTQEVLDSPQVSTDGRGELRFPKLESQFTPLHPNKLNVRRPGENKSVNIKVTRSARKRKSNEMEKDPVESENKKNIKLRVNNRVNMQSPTVLGVKTDQNKQQTPASLKGKKDGTFQKIGDFIQSSPTLLGGEAKTMMGIVNGRSTKREKATSVKPKRTKRKLYKTDISSPLDIPSHPIIGLDQDEKESDHLIIRRQLRSRTARK